MTNWSGYLPSTCLVHFRVIQAALPKLREQGSGHIVNITSIAGRAPMASSGAYAAAKSAMEGLSQSLSQEVAPFGIKVTAVAPGGFPNGLPEQPLRATQQLTNGQHLCGHGRQGDRAS